ncbi:hypothetical protein A3J20_03345 [Candidatus Gottesmanbacteria bacterium RIFCSPLOWO2_02_FULL_42_29]|uniref:Uncharacterized protein n=2 Tax=Candidatus Gottesmaniibacteriota TaxID=1752720 RepID=A0A1F6BDL4_9BACT|nr:MAG: hypothetical protein UV09_C0002G0035 [Candidatus Gottesmanbacteria bacterium GW2011_GWA2_42_18]KKS75650.1 MAG: hypothetical protein UV46_C0015G0026 [Candidatus Gottesmanbacteria bacterium GW2011_GWC2_42_8]OGG12211.1 MAG: hypothetical protein A2781_04830 [Candidatus Gottesmanbacteria bacterium RIFCSPHIGHO2_01_FULL_42_27]OGG21699.1 MAG: hypothetical protein A3E72_04495 [Candidatus Gottesmanbacteria bacterium RIFCSPHIGHO2_12_FULL_43_26]OGG34238.1 MAG: hypothetical protein A3G68_02960 [Cand
MENIRIFIINHKKLIIILLITIILITIFLVSLFLFNTSSAPPPEVKTTPFPFQPNGDFRPFDKLTNLTPTMPFTGADDAANEKYMQKHPELTTEAELKAKLPIETDDFTLDYSYPEDKFTVTFKQPGIVSQKIFEDWMESMDLGDKNRFIFLN